MTKAQRLKISDSVTCCTGNSIGTRRSLLDSADHPPEPVHTTAHHRLQCPPSPPSPPSPPTSPPTKYLPWSNTPSLCMTEAARTGACTPGATYCSTSRHWHEVSHPSTGASCGPSSSRRIGWCLRCGVAKNPGDGYALRYGTEGLEDGVDGQLGRYADFFGHSASFPGIASAFRSPPSTPPRTATSCSCDARPRTVL